MSKTRYKGGLNFDGKRSRALKGLAPSEAKIQSAISQLLDLRYVVHAITDARTVQTVNGPRRCVTPAGWADITAILPITGRLWAIEVKSETGRLRPSQEDLLPQIEASGALVTVARDCLPINEVLHEHMRQFTVAEINAYKDEVRRLRQEIARRDLERERAKRRGTSVGGRLSKTVETPSSPALFDPSPARSG